MIVRDFIYVDGDRLYSLYSQAFEGVAERIVQSYIDEMGSVNTQKGSALSGETVATQVAEVSRRTENRVLYDHMYSQLEAKLSSALTEPADMSKRNYVERLAGSFMVKVTGVAEIEDYERLQAFVANFNLLGQAIAYAGMLSSGLTDELQTVQDTQGSKRTRGQRAGGKSRSGEAAVKAVAEAMGLQQDEQLLRNLKLFSDMFNKEGFEVTITPDVETEGIVFRGVMHKRWLRTQPNLLRSMYGTKPGAKWTMVGQVTHLPGNDAALPAPLEELVEPSEDEDAPSMRDPFRAMFGASGVFERMFLESRQRTEVVIAPLALYREYSLP